MPSRSVKKTGRSVKKRYRVPVYGLRLVQERTMLYSVPTIECDGHAAAILHAELDDADRERLLVIALNGCGVPVGVEVAAVGGLHGCAVSPRDLLKVALLLNASTFILGHNHPSGDPTPSDEDMTLTRAVQRGAALLGTPLVDHVIVSPNGKHFSMHEAGVL